MAPVVGKKQPPAKSEKAEQKQKAKIVEDKTFGLKNKNKSKTVQNYIKGLAQQVKGPVKGGDSAVKGKEVTAKEEKKKAMQQAALLNSLFRGTENIKKIDASAFAKKDDPKCIREDQKINLYVDEREQREPDTMQNWDLEKLQEVINTKHTAENVNRPTEIVCRYFLTAVENKAYGWFWGCPNGDKCKYRHCLPPGYVLKKEAIEEIDPADEIPIEERIEDARAALPRENLTAVTLETFVAWKQKKEEARLNALEEKRIAEANKKGGRGLGVMTGRDLFQFDPSLFVDDEGAAAADDYEEDENYWNDAIAENQRLRDAQAKTNSDEDEESDEDSEEESNEDAEEESNEDAEEESNEDAEEESNEDAEKATSLRIEAKENADTATEANASRSVEVGDSSLFAEGEEEFPVS